MRKLSENAIASQKGKYTHDGAVEAWAAAFREALASPPRAGRKLRIAYPPDGRLAQMGIHPWISERFRNALKLRHAHAEGSGEWPTGSPLMTKKARDEIMEIPARMESH
jgi:hypothetical protein